MVAPDELPEASSVQSVKATFGGPLCVKPPYADRCLEAADTHLSEIGKSELVSDQLACRIGNHHHIGASKALQTSREIGGFADNCPALVDARADEIANDDLACCYTRARRKAFAGRRPEGPHRIKCGECPTSARAASSSCA